jgi:hypothetical protein
MEARVHPYDASATIQRAAGMKRFVSLNVLVYQQFML